MNKKNIISIATALFAITTSTFAQAANTPTFLIGETVRGTDGKTYRVVLQEVVEQPTKVVQVTPAAPAPQPTPVVHAQPQAQPSSGGSAAGNYVKDVVVTGAGGAATGAILGGITGRNAGKEALGMGAGAVGGKVVTDVLGGLIKR